MANFTQLKQEYASIIVAVLEQNKDILIESFVEYYGEEFRARIVSRYNQIVFSFCYAPKITDFMIKENPSLFANKDDFTKVLLDFHKAYQKSDILDNIVWMSDDNVLSIPIIRDILTEYLNDEYPECCHYGFAADSKRLVSLPILLLSDVDVIHEINHALTRDIIAYLVKDGYITNYVSKVGLSVDFIKPSDEQLGEELMNELASREITKIFHRRGGDFSKICLNLPLHDVYADNLYLASSIYGKFKDSLKVSRISDNKNAFVNQVGNSNYRAYVDLVNRYFITKTSVANEKYEESRRERDALISEMEKYASTQNITTQSLEEYYDYLRSLGYTVNPIESFDGSGSTRTRKNK